MALNGKEGVSRRALLCSAMAAGAAFVPELGRAATTQALAFDAFAIFDPRTIAASANLLLGDKGDQLATTWSAKLFGYTWLTTAANRYRDFAQLAEAALISSAESLGLTLSGAERAQLMAAYSELNLWPDVKSALSGMSAAGIRLTILSNLDDMTLRTNIHRAGIGSLFEAVLSTDRVRQFKPSPVAYQMAVDALNLRKTSIGFVASAAWDAAGATWFGYPTAWINRLSAPEELFGIRPTVISRGMDGALALGGLG